MVETTQWCYLTFSIFKVFCELLLGSRASAAALTADIVACDMYERVSESGSLGWRGISAFACFARLQ